MVENLTAALRAADWEAETQARGQELLGLLRGGQRRSLQDRLFDWIIAQTTADEGLKVELFRFVDALPTLRTPHAVAGHLAEYLEQPSVDLPPGLQRLMGLLHRSSAAEFIAAEAAQIGTRMMAHRFIAGRDANTATAQVQRLRRRNLAFSIDLLGEAVISETEADEYQNRYLNLIQELTDIAATWPPKAQLDDSPYGQLPRVNVSIKLTALYSRFDPMAAEDTAQAVKERLRPILRLARQRGAFVNFDMEQNDAGPLSRRIFQEILTETEFHDWRDVGIVQQAYLRSAADDLEKLLSWAEKRGTPVWVRLVKGAYWDYENIIAAQRGYPSPVFCQKAETDANYEKLTEVLLRNWQHLHPAIATHNVRSAAHAQALAATLDLPPNAVEYQVLFGMGEPIGNALAAQGERVRVYVPCGELLPGMAYLVRRLLENTANDSFIRHFEQDRLRDSELLAPPLATEPVLTPAENHGFTNEPVTDFALHSNRAEMKAALKAVEGQLGAVVPIVINGQNEESEQVVDRPDPSQAERAASRSHWASAAQADRALQGATEAFGHWNATPVTRRAEMLRRVAAEYRRRRFEIAAWQIYETGKPWRDADADIAEAIDFCEYYALEMERLSTTRRRDVPGEWNDYVYDARGPAVIIAPWNFPLAILTGMAVAALVAGNPVILKPAEQSARVGYFLMEALQAAGLPGGVAQFLPGEGEVIGPLLVNDARTALIAFTGSRDVGLSILQESSVVRPGQREIKHVIAELGGKNAIIVDEDADLDEAVSGVLASAIGYSGQKCSACSRAIVVGSAYEPFCLRLAAAVASIRIGPAADPATTLGPLIDKQAQERVLDTITRGRQEAGLLAMQSPPKALEDTGFYVPAAVFTSCPPEGHLWRDEIFGPVLALRAAKDLGEAFALANDSEYALTGGFYSRSPHNIERARHEFRAGNLYINRRITGALVDRQPFGGRGMSGGGTKAGGPDYLQHFLIPRTITESVMRHGFAPDDASRTD